MESSRYKTYNDNLNRKQTESIISNSSKPNKLLHEIPGIFKIEVSEDAISNLIVETSKENRTDVQLEADNKFKEEIFKLYSTPGSGIVKYYEEIDEEYDSSLSRIYRRAVSTVPMVYDTFGKCINDLYNSLSETDKMICSVECAIENKVELDKRGINNRILDYEIASKNVDVAYNYWSIIYYALSRVKDNSIKGLKKKLKRLQKESFINISELIALKENNELDVNTKIKMIRIYLSAIRSENIDRYLELAEDAIYVANGNIADSSEYKKCR